jgi:hypothetical protein
MIVFEGSSQILSLINHAFEQQQALFFVAYTSMSASLVVNHLVTVFTVKIKIQCVLETD